MSIAPHKPMLGAVANLYSVLPFLGLHEQPRQCLQGGKDTTMLPLSDTVSQIKVSPVIEEGSMGGSMKTP
jgi:hypothetical protein